MKTEIQRNQRLLKIAKPVDLPFMRNPLEQSKSEQSQGEVKRRQLPMIGKRNQFSKFKIVKPQENSSASKSSKPPAQLASDEEEVEEEDSVETKVVDDEKHKPESKVNIDEIFERNLENQEDKPNLIKPSLDVDEERSESPSKESSKMDECTEKIVSKVECNSEPENKKEQCKSDAPSKDEKKDSNLTECPKKKRQRNRQRTKREAEMEDDIEYESSDKYAKWVPPENQTGDGITELNKKYGY